MTVTVARELDCRGLASPLPVLRAAQAIRSIPWGTTILVFATDPHAVKEFGAWARASGNELVGQYAHGHVYRFVVRRGRGRDAAPAPRGAEPRRGT
jgi:tRNA 2-thiouridine synthesizing protein A